MSFQSICIRRFKVAQVAFVCFFSTVGFQMSPQMACPRRCKITLVAFAWLFSTVRFKMSAREEAKPHWLHLFNLYRVRCPWWNQRHRIRYGAPDEACEPEWILLKNYPKIRGTRAKTVKLLCNENIDHRLDKGYLGPIKSKNRENNQTQNTTY